MDFWLKVLLAVHVVIAPVLALLSIAVADELMSVEAFADRLASAGKSPKAILNGGFFDPNNGKTTSHIVIDSQRAGDPAENERLTGNPNLQAFLPQIFNRSEFRVYDWKMLIKKYSMNYEIENILEQQGSKIEEVPIQFDSEKNTDNYVQPIIIQSKSKKLRNSIDANTTEHARIYRIKINYSDLKTG